MELPVYGYKIPPTIASWYNRSRDNPEEFWNEIAEKFMNDIYWHRKWDKVFEPTPGYSFKWFSGGLTNVGYNCVDYKFKRNLNRLAYIYEAPELGQTRLVTYGELYKLVRDCSASLREMGISKGDVIMLYLPNSIEAVTVLLACARIGAISCSIFAGFSPAAIATRIQLSQPKLIFTQDYSSRRGKAIRLKNYVDEALKLSPETIVKELKVVVRESGVSGEKPNMVSGRDMWWQEFEQMAKFGNGEHTWVEANEPLFILPTSGTTAIPKPVVHVHGGYQIWVYSTAKWVYGLEPGDILFNASDIGWIVGQSYLVFGPLLTGCTTILYDGTPDYPRTDIWWEVMEKHNATICWMSPTAVRALFRLGEEPAKRHDLSSIERIVCAGEVLNPEVQTWLQQKVFDNKIPVIDHMWQTETSGTLFGNLYGLGLLPIKPGSCGIPMPGVFPQILDERTGEPCPTGTKGVMVLEKPFPGLTPTLWRDPERYAKDYWEMKDWAKGKYWVGDSAWRDEDGYIWFTGRADEVIKIAAHRIGPIEVENAIISHPAVAEVGVSGVPDELRGEVAAGFVVLKPGYKPSKALEVELINQVKKTLGPIVVFRGIKFVNLLPKTKSGKIMRRVMKKTWTGEALGDLSTIEEEASVDEIKEAIEKLKVLSEDKV